MYFDYSNVRQMLILVVFSLCLVIPSFAQSVSPLDFGLQQARDGKDRYYVIKACHEYAIKNGVEVSYAGIKEIDIEIPNDATRIPLSNYTDFNNVVLNVTNNNGDITLFHLYTPLYRCDINNTNVNSGNFIGIKGLSDGNKLVIVEDVNLWVANRQGYDYGAKRMDILVTKDGIAQNTIIYPFNNGSKAKGVCCSYSDTFKTIRNLVFRRTSNSTKITNVLFVENQVNVILSNISVHTPQNTKMFGDGAIQIKNSANITLDQIKVFGTYSLSNKYGYGISINNVYDLKVNRMYARANWGVFGTNNINKATLRDCDINRFDIHCYGRDVRCYNCKFTDLYNQFSSVYGDVYYEKCTFSNFIPVLIESSYNAYTPFDLTFKSCTFNLTGKKNYIMTLSGLEAAHNSRPELYRKALPNITIKNCTVKLAEDVKEWYIVNTGKVTYKEPLDYINKIEVNRLKINGNVDYKVFSTELKTTEPLKHVRKRVKMKTN